LLGSLFCQGAANSKWESIPPGDKFEVRLFPQTDGKQHFSQENPVDSMLMRCASMRTHPTSTTKSLYSASTTAVPATNQPAPYAAPTASAPNVSPTWRSSIYANDIYLCSFPDE